MFIFLITNSFKPFRLKNIILKSSKFDFNNLYGCNMTFRRTGPGSSRAPRLINWILVPLIHGSPCSLFSAVLFQIFELDSDRLPIVLVHLWASGLSRLHVSDTLYRLVLWMTNWELFPR